MTVDDLDPWRQSTPGVAAHRGGKAIAPENTIAGILEGLAAGATHLEVDVRGTADGEAVCIHDANAERTCREDAQIAELTLQEVQRLDPCVQWSEHAGIATGDAEPPQGMGPEHFRIPRLSRVLRTFGGVPTILDLKDTAPVDAVVDAIDEGWQRTEDLLVGGYDDAKLERFRDELPGVPTAAGRNEAQRFFEGHNTAADAIVVPPEHEGIELVSPEAIERAHGTDAAFWVWTVNDLDTARELFEAGVDGVITDQPGKMARERAKLF